MAAKITRALLERYLRATGQTLDPGAEALAEEGASPEAVCTWFALKRGHMVVGLGVRLGLCAAAEDCFETMRSLNAPSILGAQAERLLRMAGVDPARWEEARHG